MFHVRRNYFIARGLFEATALACGVVRPRGAAVYGPRGAGPPPCVLRSNYCKTFFSFVLGVAGYHIIHQSGSIFILKTCTLESWPTTRVASPRRALARPAAQGFALASHCRHHLSRHPHHDHRASSDSKSMTMRGEAGLCSQNGIPASLSIRRDATVESSWCFSSER